MKFAEVNQLTALQFVEAFGEVYEHSPTIAHEAHRKRPFRNTDELYEAFTRTVDRKSEQAHLQLILLHPDLAGKLANAGKLTKASSKEQKSAGLDFLSDEERQQFDALNSQYKKTFKFPFIICARDHNKKQILAAFQSRLENSDKQERREALNQIHRIAWHRINDLINEK